MSLQKLLLVVSLTDGKIIIIQYVESMILFIDCIPKGSLATLTVWI